jgi:hypothetical protein
MAHFPAERAARANFINENQRNRLSIRIAPGTVFGSVTNAHRTT